MPAACMASVKTLSNVVSVHIWGAYLPIMSIHFELGLFSFHETLECVNFEWHEIVFDVGKEIVKRT